MPLVDLICSFWPFAEHHGADAMEYMHHTTVMAQRVKEVRTHIDILRYWILPLSASILLTILRSVCASLTSDRTVVPIEHNFILDVFLLPLPFFS